MCAANQLVYTSDTSVMFFLVSIAKFCLEVSFILPTLHFPLLSILLLLYTLYVKLAPTHPLNSAELLNGAVKSLYRHILWHTTISIQDSGGI